jgi:pimeloyl-ACP methyl ester carboxylesterase
MKAMPVAAVLSIVAATLGAGHSISELVPPQKEPPVQRKTCTSSDGVTLVYSAAGDGDTALLFIHGGFADRSFYDAQFRGFSGRYRVIAIDLAGHGESGANRREWTLARFAADVKAVADAERLTRIVLFGNSLGGPVAIEAALLLPGRAIGVVGIDTFQDLAHERTPEYRRQEAEAVRLRADAFRKDPAGSMKAMVGMLFHPDADPRLRDEAERRMMRTSPVVVDGVLAGLVGYDYTPAVRTLTVPLRAINGDLYPTDVPAARRVKADFDAVVMTHAGHYPMLERPDEFNRLAGETVAAILASASGPTRRSAGLHDRPRAVPGALVGSGPAGGGARVGDSPPAGGARGSHRLQAPRTRPAVELRGRPVRVPRGQVRQGRGLLADDAVPGRARRPPGVIPGPGLAAFAPAGGADVRLRGEGRRHAGISRCSGSRSAALLANQAHSSKRLERILIHSFESATVNVSGAALRYLAASAFSSNASTAMKRDVEDFLMRAASWSILAASAARRVSVNWLCSKTSRSIAVISGRYSSAFRIGGIGKYAPRST